MAARKPTWIAFVAVIPALIIDRFIRGQAVLLVPLLLGPSAQANAPPDLTQLLDCLYVNLPHTSFEWVEADGVSERAAIRVPVRADGVDGSFQLDTGLDETLVNGEIPSKRGWETHDGMVHLPSFEIGGMDLGPTWLHARPDEGKAGKLDGSIGLDLLIGSWILIDDPGQRLAILDRGEVPLSILQRATWTPAEIRYARLFPIVTLAGKTKGTTAP